MTKRTALVFRPEGEGTQRLESQEGTSRTKFTLSFEHESKQRSSPMLLSVLSWAFGRLRRMFQS